jgi:hypothetical protein
MEPKRLRSPPYNTAVRDLVQGKRAWSPALAKKGVPHVTSGAGTLRQCWQQGYWDRGAIGIRLPEELALRTS